MTDERSNEPSEKRGEAADPGPEAPAGSAAGDGGQEAVPPEKKLPKKLPKRPPPKPAPAETGAAAAPAGDEDAAKAKAEALRKKKEAEAAAEAAKPPWERNPTAPEWEEAEDDPLVAPLRERFGEAIGPARRFAGDLTLEIARERIADVGEALRDEHSFTYLVDLCAADYPERETRFDVVYHLYSFEENRRIRLRVQADETTPVPTVTTVWKVAGWPEREVWDMYGVSFVGHPDMTRILTWEGFNGHPLRKDFPLEGIDTGAAIYPERYDGEAGPVVGTGTGWKVPQPASEEAGEEQEQ